MQRMRSCQHGMQFAGHVQDNSVAFAAGGYRVLKGRPGSDRVIGREMGRVRDREIESDTGKS